MYHSILVPLDGSQLAEEALPLATAVAENTRACLEIAQVHTCTALQSTISGWEPYYDPAREAVIEEQQRAYLDVIVQRLRTDASVSATSVLLNGPVVDALLGRARSRSVDLIVMSGRGHRPIGRFCLGSVADELVHSSPLPILLTPPRVASGTPCPVSKLRRVMVPLNGSDLAEEAIEPAISLAAREYLLVRVVDRPQLSNCFHPLSDDTTARQSAEAETYLDAVAARLRVKGLRIETKVTVGASTSAALLEIAKKDLIDVIALATHCRTGFRRLIMGSIASQVVRCAETPILVCR